MDDLDDDEPGAFYAWITFARRRVLTAIFAEFFRGGRVIQQTGQNLLGLHGQLTRRNTRRYGGYIVHFGIVLIFIGIAGRAFNQSHEQDDELQAELHARAISGGVPGLFPGFESELRH